MGNISHSSKGSSWDDHKYIKKVNGKYYYPSDYKGDRHAGDKSKNPISSDERYNRDDKSILESEEAWESTVYGDIDRIMRENPQLKDPVQLARIAFENNLRGKMSDEEIERMMTKVKAHYGSKKEPEISKSLQKDSSRSSAVKKAGTAIENVAQVLKKVSKKKIIKHGFDDLDDFLTASVKLKNKENTNDLPSMVIESLDKKVKALSDKASLYDLINLLSEREVSKIHSMVKNKLKERGLKKKTIMIS